MARGAAAGVTTEVGVRFNPVNGQDSIGLSGAITEPDGTALGGFPHLHHFHGRFAGHAEILRQHSQRGQNAPLPIGGGAAVAPPMAGTMNGCMPARRNSRMTDATTAAIRAIPRLPTAMATRLPFGRHHFVGERTSAIRSAT